MSNKIGTNSHTIIVCAISAVVGGLSTYWYCQRRTTSSNKGVKQQQQQNNEHYTIPDEIRNSDCIYIKELHVGIELAIECGNRMYQYCNNKGTINELTLQINTKGQAEDFCTQIDIENENCIIQRIQTEFPNHIIIGEESVGTGIIPDLSTTIPTWIIDPIDGTTNFASGLPLTCVSIGFCTNGIPIMGIVYVPMTNELYIGIVGYGAYRNGIKLTKRSNNTTTTTTTTNKLLKDSIICYEFGYTRDEIGIDLMINVVRNILKNGCKTTRTFGSGVLDLLYVATGRIDIVYTGVATEGWKPWDYCAAYVILSECNCIIQSIDNNNNNTINESDIQKPFNIYTKSMICAINTSLVSEVRTIIQNTKKEIPNMYEL